MLVRRALWLGPALAACLPEPGTAETSAFDVSFGPPSITDLSASCTKKSGAWRLEVTTSAWTSKALWTWTVNGRYVEQHTLKSVGASDEGDADLLRVDLGAIIDWRTYTAGQNSAFTCVDTPNGVVTVFDLDDTRTHCLRFGPAPDAVLGVPGVPECDQVWPEDVYAEDEATDAPASDE